MGQTTLLLFAIVPYLILRYFFGGMQLFSELLLLFSLFLLSGVLTAITVGLSASTLALVRAIPLLGAFFLAVVIWGFCFEAFDDLIEFFTPQTGDHVLGLLATYLIASFVGYFFLELAATAIAPSAENRATRKRIVSLIALPLAFICLFQVDEDAAWVLALILSGIVSLDLFTENTEYPSVVLQPFANKGPLGAILARFFAPGWGTGILFHLFLLSLIFLLDFALGGFTRDPSYEEMAGISLSVIGMFYCPLFLLNIFQKKIKNRFVSYILFAVLLFAFMPLLGLLEGLGDIDTLAIISCFIPQAQPFLPYDPSDSEFQLIAGITTAVYICGNLFYAFRPLRELNKSFRSEVQRQQEEGTESA